MSEGDFNEGWSRKKNLAYDLGCDLSGLVGFSSYFRSQAGRSEKKQSDNSLLPSA